MLDCVAEHDDITDTPAANKSNSLPASLKVRRTSQKPTLKEDSSNHNKGIEVESRNLSKQRIILTPLHFYKSNTQSIKSLSDTTYRPSMIRCLEYREKLFMVSKIFAGFLIHMASIPRSKLRYVAAWVMFALLIWLHGFLLKMQLQIKTEAAIYCLKRDIPRLQVLLQWRRTSIVEILKEAELEANVIVIHLWSDKMSKNIRTKWTED